MFVQSFSLRPIFITVIVMGLCSLGLGLGFVTVWKPNPVVTVSSPTTSKEPYLVSGLNVLESTATKVKIRAVGKKDQMIRMAIGTTQDALAWASKLDYILADGFASDSKFSIKKVLNTKNIKSETTTAAGNKEKEEKEKAEQEQRQSPAAQTVAISDLDPLDSDMWVARAQGKGSAQIQWTQRDNRWSVLVATDGKSPAPRLELSWQMPRTNIGAWICFIAGSLMILIATTLLIMFEIADKRTLQKIRDTKAKERAKLASIGVKESFTLENEATTSTTTISRRALRQAQEREAKSKKTFLFKRKTRRDMEDPWRQDSDPIDKKSSETLETENKDKKIVALEKELGESHE